MKDTDKLPLFPFLSILFFFNLIVAVLLYTYSGIPAVKTNWYLFLVITIGAFLLVSKSVLFRWAGRSMLMSVIIGLIIKGVVI